MSGLTERAKAAAESSVLPEHWGELVEIEVGGSFEGRHRGHDDGGKSGAWLFWDAAGEECFIWGCYRLDQEFEREQVPVGATTVVYRSENYTTRYDKDGEATGLAYGIAWEPNDAPLPGSGADGIPF